MEIWESIHDSNPDKKRCEECGWEVTIINGMQCLNKNCSLRNQGQIDRYDYYKRTGRWPDERE